MEPWDTNIKILRERYPGLEEELHRNQGPPRKILVEKSAAGDPTLIIEGIHIHSPRDPVREGRRLAQGLTGDGPLVVLGFGLGYAAEALAAAQPERPLIILERHGAVLKKALETRDLGEFLHERRLIFVVGGTGEGITGALALFGGAAPGEGSSPEFLKNRALMQLDEAWYTGVEHRIRTWTSREDVNMATLRRFGRRWVRNLARNMEAARDLPGISRLAGCLSLPAWKKDGTKGSSGPPVLLVAAGPSLDRVRTLLPAFAERCVLVAVDTSLGLVLRTGVSPDFTLVVDPQYWNARHLDRTAAITGCLVTESAVYPPVLRQPFGRTFLCGSLFPLGRFIEDMVDPKGPLGAGGSVAAGAWDFARVLGASSVWWAGLDLAFPELKTHFKGALFEERALAVGNRFIPPETWSVRALRDGQPFWAAAAGGGTVLTDRRLSLYSAWFENRFRLYPEVHTRSFSPGGLAIPGMDLADPEELLALPPRRDEINRILGEVFAQITGDFYSPQRIEERARAFRKARDTLLEGLEGIKSLAEEAERRAAAAYGDLGRKKNVEERILAKLDETNRRISSSAVKDVAGFLFPPAEELEARLESPPGKPLERYLELSTKLYRALALAAEYNLSVLRAFPPKGSKG
ncbi:DUF115 domain-containing protein [Treponema sp. TIM-1]|uniref:motility associated factor glycosyltransferase family protein n=1 Tax=Treponema sp. TIM-1 TaxID=2898417 RepID=UPI003980CE3C